MDRHSLRDRHRPTKTLAKLANHIAKTAERKPGSYPDQHAQVCHLGAVAQRNWTT
jgi:hypothetical protein